MRMYSWGVAKRRAAICMRRVYSKGKGGGRRRREEEEGGGLHGFAYVARAR